MTSFRLKPVSGMTRLLSHRVVCKLYHTRMTEICPQIPDMKIQHGRFCWLRLAAML